MMRDSRLSFGARGLFSYLWDMPRCWSANAKHLTSQSPAGRDAVIRMLRELEAVGAMRYEAVRRDDGKMDGTIWVLISPNLWAIKTPLKTVKRLKKTTPQKALKPKPVADSTEALKNRKSASPKIGKSSPKGIQNNKGSPIQTKVEAGSADSDSDQTAAFDQEPTSKPKPTSSEDALAKCNELMEGYLQNQKDEIRWDALVKDFDGEILLSVILEIIVEGSEQWISTIVKKLRKPTRTTKGGASFSTADSILQKMKIVKKQTIKNSTISEIKAQIKPVPSQTVALRC